MANENSIKTIFRTLFKEYRDYYEEASRSFPENDAELRTREFLFIKNNYLEDLDYTKSDFDTQWPVFKKSALKVISKSDVQFSIKEVEISKVLEILENHLRSLPSQKPVSSEKRPMEYGSLDSRLQALKYSGNYDLSTDNLPSDYLMHTFAS